jgi:hypothetical protein
VSSMRLSDDNILHLTELVKSALRDVAADRSISTISVHVDDQGATRTSSMLGTSGQPVVDVTIILSVSAPSPSRSGS